ncbi:MAG: type I methionyl aminopeptidase [Candidatus Buchananbacteria bacterium]
MIKLKTQEQIKTLREGGKILAEILDLVIEYIKPGITTGELNDYAESLIAKFKGEGSFKNYKAAWAEKAYPASLCVSLNNEVVHGIPDHKRKIDEGDIVSLDCGLIYKGLYTDMAKSVGVGKVSKEARKLMSVTEEALMAGIEKIAPDVKLSEISKTIQGVIEKSRFSVVRQLVGHGVGFSAHEDPQIPNYLSRSFPEVILKPGMVLAIEPMVNAGGWEVDTLDDGWTIVTADDSLSAHFEHTVAVTEKGFEILTLR